MTPKPKRQRGLYYQAQNYTVRLGTSKRNVQDVFSAISVAKGWFERAFGFIPRSSSNIYFMPCGKPRRGGK